MKRILPKAAVLERLGGISDTTLWRMCQKGQFPKPIKISDNRVGWEEEIVDANIAARTAEAEAA